MLTVQKKDIAPILKNAVKVAKEKSTIRIFSHFAVSVDSGLMTITAGDGARSFSESCAVEGDNVQFTINAEKLNKAINTFKAGDINITPGNPSTTVSQGRSTINIDSLNYGDFPIVPAEQAKPTGLTSGELQNAISRIGHAMATKDVRPMLNGVHLTKGSIVATDGHRMAYQDVNYDGIDIIIPADSIPKMPQIEGDVFVSDSQLIIKGETASFTTNLIDSKFVNWRKVIPENIELTSTFNKDDMINAIQQALISDDNGTIEFGKAEIIVKNSGSNAFIESENTSEGITAFRLQYLLDAIRNCEGDTITMQSGGTTRPSIINDNFVVMPVRI